jgi:hypothetical protein
MQIAQEELTSAIASSSARILKEIREEEAAERRHSGLLHARLINRPHKPKPPSEGVAARWTPLLAHQWTPVSNYFLANYTRLPSPIVGQRPLNPTEAMLLIQLISFKNGTSNPYPSAKTLARRLGMSDRAVRTSLGDLEARGLLKRIPDEGSTNQFDLSGLFSALETLLGQDVRALQELNLGPQGE